MTMTINKLTQSDIDLIDPRKEDLKLYAEIPQIKEKLLQIKESEIFSIKKNNELITIIGLTKLYDGVGQTWQLPNYGMIRKHLKESVRALKSLENTFFNKGYWRIFTYCECDYVHTKWMKFLGYTREGLLKKHSYNGEDVFIWAKVR